MTQSTIDNAVADFITGLVQHAAYTSRTKDATLPIVQWKSYPKIKEALTNLIAQEANKARLEEIDLMICNRHYGEGYADFFTEYANERRAVLTADKVDQ